MKKSNKSKIIRYRFGQWTLELIPADGARIRRLAYRRMELLTPPPRTFRPPRNYPGQYEKRPVYGYDDCFPTVDPCRYPSGNLSLPDHGEICWLKGNCFTFENGLKCVFVSRILPFVFEREMIFAGNCLAWIFTVVNTGRKALPFIHVMHPLMPVSRVRKLDLPDFSKIIDEQTGRTLGLKKATDVEKKLLSSPIGRADMFLLRGVQEGFFRIHFHGGANLAVSYDRKIFPTLGIWWNRSGFPAENGLARNECAIEPIPGAWSSLKSAVETGKCFFVLPHQAFSWRIEWRISV
ncbi:MAG: hypothetical protein Q7J98_11570 [Kiritimatiellia bacterium]|nr:hypothetical protein [Kiritimatiellia bacterium]